MGRGEEGRERPVAMGTCSFTITCTSYWKVEALFN